MLTGKVRIQVTVARKMTQPSARMAVWLLIDASFVETPAKKGDTAKRTTART
jgi:hypothetical protein